jgi:hypothetical protein
MTSPCLTASLSNVERGRGEVSPEILVGRQPGPGPSKIEKVCQGNIKPGNGHYFVNKKPQYKCNWNSCQTTLKK